VAGSGYRGNADSLLRRLVTLVKALPRNARRLWNTAQSREFNVGIEAAAKSRTFELRLEPETLMAVAGVAQERQPSGPLDDGKRSTIAAPLIEPASR
jgi:hypothetical protein